MEPPAPRIPLYCHSINPVPGLKMRLAKYLFLAPRNKNCTKFFVTLCIIRCETKIWYTYCKVLVLTFTLAISTNPFFRNKQYPWYCSRPTKHLVGWWYVLIFIQPTYSVEFTLGSRCFYSIFRLIRLWTRLIQRKWLRRKWDGFAHLVSMTI